MAHGKRYRRWLDPIDRIGRPRVLAAVAVSAEATVSQSAQPVRTETMTGWAIVVLGKAKGGYRRVTAREGTDASALWDVLFGFATEWGLRLVAVNGGTRTFTLLNIWEGIESGRIILGGDGSDDGEINRNAVRDVRPVHPDRPTGGSSSDVSGLFRRTRPALCIDDPPWIVGVSAPGESKGLTLWDIRNWGCSLPSPSPSAMEEVDRVAKWIEDFEHLTRQSSLPGVTVTPGQWAMKAFRSKHYGGGMYIHTHTKAIELEAAAYHGGRCEAFKLGKIPGKCLLFDRRSAYVWVASLAAVPVRLIGYLDKGELSSTRDVSIGHGVIATVRVNVRNPVVPLRRGGDVIYPVGRFWTSLCQPEIALAEENGTVEKWGPTALYELEPSLAGWARAMGELRYNAEQRGNKAVMAAMKTSGVAFLGKLAQKRRGWEPCPAMDGRLWYGDSWGKLPGGTPGRYRWVAGQCFFQTDKGWSRDAQVAVAAWITSWARVSLWQTLQRFGRQNVHYIDTDCWMVSDTANILNVDGREGPDWHLGRVELRHGPADAEIYGLKHYRIGDKVVTAGIPKGMLVQDKDSGAHWYLPSAGEQIPGRQRPTAVFRPNVNAKDGRYRHGIVCDDGAVEPIRLQEE